MGTLHPMKPPAANVDAYLDQIENPAYRKQLDHLRKLIQSTVPEAEECISYGIPTYKHFGMVVSFAAFAKHLSFFPGHTVADFQDQLKGFKTSKGTIQFTPENPLPDELVTAIVQHRARENEEAHRAKFEAKKAKK